LNNGFLVSYFAFELDLRNITTAISAEKMGIDYANKMIPFGRAYGIILENGTAGDALKQEFDYSSRLLEVFGSPDVVAMEREIDAIRWAWLDEATEKDGFSADSVLAYALKLQVLHRWANLEEEKGRKLFDDLVGIIKRSIRFSIEFSTAGEKKQ
jgi:hypothetical protein